MRRLISFIMFLTVLGHLDVNAQFYNCDPNFPNNEEVWITEFNIYAQDPSGMFNTDSIELMLTNEDECFFYTDDTLKYVHQLTFDFQHNLTMGEKVYAKIWVDLNEDGLVTDNEAVFTDSTTTTGFSGLFALTSTLSEDDFLGAIRVAVAPTLEEVEANTQLLFMSKKDRPRVTLGNSPDGIDSICIPLKEMLLFDIINYTGGDLSNVSVELSITGIQHHTGSITRSADIYHYIDATVTTGPPCGSSSNPSPTSFPFLMGCEDVLTISLDIGTVASVINPANLGLTEVKVRVKVGSSDFQTANFYLGCCKKSGINYNKPTDSSNNATWLPYHKAAPNITIGNAAITAYSLPSQEVYLKAEEYIQLKPGVHFEDGVISRLYIEPCMGPTDEEEFETLTATNTTDSSIATSTNVTIDKQHNEAIVLECIPNPFQDHSRIKYEIPKQAKVDLILYDMLGRSIKRLIPNQIQEQGNYEVYLYSDDLPSGIYLLNLKVDNTSSFLKVVKS